VNDPISFERTVARKDHLFAGFRHRKRESTRIALWPVRRFRRLTESIPQVAADPPREIQLRRDASENGLCCHGFTLAEARAPVVRVNSLQFF
jgi:hypothetical protein